MAWRYSIVWIDHILLIHSSIGGLLGCFPFSATVSIPMFVWTCVFSALLSIAGSGIAGSSGNCVRLAEEPVAIFLSVTFLQDTPGLWDDLGILAACPSDVSGPQAWTQTPWPLPCTAPACVELCSAFQTLAQLVMKQPTWHHLRCT